MTTLFSTTYLDSARTEAQMKANVLHNLRSVIKELPGGNEDIPALTISGGSVTPTAAIHTVDTEGAAASDTLSNIATTNMPEGRLLLIHIADGSRLVTVEHEGGGAGQISLADSADLLLGETTHWLMLLCDGTDWAEIARFGYEITAEAWGVRCLSGCTPTNDTDTDHDVNISAGYHILTDGSGNYKQFHLAADLCKQIDAAWAAGDDAGGLADGLSLAASTMYYLHLIGKDDGTVDAVFDTSATAANRDSDYGWYGCLHGNFVVFTDSSSNIRKFHVACKQVRYLSAIVDVNDSTITADTYETATITAPPNSIALLLVTGQASAASGNAGVYVTLKNPTSTEAKTVIQSVAPTVVRITGPAEFNINASRQLQYKGQLYVGNTVDYIGINTDGYLLTA